MRLQTACFACWAAAVSLLAAAAPLPPSAQKGIDRFFEGDLEGAVESWHSARAGVQKHVVLDGVLLLGLKVLIKEELQSRDYLVSGIHLKQARELAPDDEDLEYLAGMQGRGGDPARPWSARQRQFLDASAERESLINMVMMLDLRQKGHAEEKKGKPRDYSGFVSRLLDQQIAEPPGMRTSRPEPAEGEPPPAKMRVERVSLDQDMLGPEAELAREAKRKPPPEPEEEPEATPPEDEDDLPPPPPRRRGKPPGVAHSLPRTDVAYRLRLGHSLFYKGDYKGAMKWFQLAMSEDSDNEEAQTSFALAVTLWREKRAEFKCQYALKAFYRGNYPEAERFFRQALQLQPDSDEARRGLLMVAR